jgi:polar amino acid transport system ATP-binding protein
MVFQSYNLFPHMTVLQNVIEAPVHVRRLSRSEATDLAREWLNRVGMSGKEDAYPAQLSGGQQQRAAIARALAMAPSLMLFDEVTSALDPELVAEVLRVIRDLAESTQMTMLIVTHEMRFARDVSDRVMFLDGGEIIEQGEPEVMFSNPRQQRTSQFLSQILSER